MFSPSAFDALVAVRHAELLREAAAERLASQVNRGPTRWRSRAAQALYILAVRLDPCAAPASATVARATR